MKIMDSITKWIDFYNTKGVEINSFNIAYLLKADEVEFPGYSDAEILHFIKLCLNEEVPIPMQLLVAIADTLQRTIYLHNVMGDDLGERAKNTLAELQAYL